MKASARKYVWKHLVGKLFNQAMREGFVLASWHLRVVTYTVWCCHRLPRTPRAISLLWISFVIPSQSNGRTPASIPFMGQSSTPFSIFSELSTYPALKDLVRKLGLTHVSQQDPRENWGTQRLKVESKVTLSERTSSLSVPCWKHLKISIYY